MSATGTYLDVLDAIEEPEEREIVLAADQRTKPLYPTDGPEDGTGRSWATYFTDMKAPYRDAPVSDDDTDEEPAPSLEVLVWGYVLPEEERAALSARSAPAQLVKRLTTAGWDVRVLRSLARVPAVLWKSDSKEDAADEHRIGDVRFPEYELETLVVVGEKRYPDGRPGFVVEATWDSKRGFTGARTWDPLLREEWRPGVTKSRERNAIEIEDGVTPPLGLKPWLDIVCPRPPKPEPKRRVKKEEGANGDH